MLSPGQRRGTFGHVMVSFDGNLHDVVIRGLEKTTAFSRKTALFVKTLHQSRSSNYQPPPTENGRTKTRNWFRPPHVSVLGKVEGEKASVKPETMPAAKKKNRSDSPKHSPRSSKKKPSTSSRPSSEDLKNLDDKWAERFARLEAMLLSKSFAVPVEPVVKPAKVITSQKPFFDAGASTSKLTESAELSGPSLVQATGDAVPPRGDETQQNATQPAEAPGAGTATQPVEAPGASPDALPSGTGDVALSADQTLTGGRVVQSTSGSESEDDQHSENGSLLEGNFWDSSPDREHTRDESTDQELSEEASYRETIRGVRSFMGWHKVPEFESVSSSDDNPFASFCVQPTGKVSLKLPVDD